LKTMFLLLLRPSKILIFWHSAQSSEWYLGGKRTPRRQRIRSSPPLYFRNSLGRCLADFANLSAHSPQWRRRRARKKLSTIHRPTLYLPTPSWISILFSSPKLGKEMLLCNWISALTQSIAEVWTKNVAELLLNLKSLTSTLSQLCFRNRLRVVEVTKSNFKGPQRNAYQHIFFASTSATIHKSTNFQKWRLKIAYAPSLLTNRYRIQ
jgi:hypothetical protein